MSSKQRVWYHSGLEGFCKAARDIQAHLVEEQLRARGVLGEEAIRDELKGLSSITFAAELFNGSDRFDTAPGRTRTWSLGNEHYTGRGNSRPNIFEASWCGKGSFGPDFQIPALARCTRAMTGAGEGSATFTPAFVDLLETLDATGETDLLRTQLLPAVCAGFETERYLPSAIQHFSNETADFLVDLPLNDAAMVQSLVQRLVAAVIYGPLHPFACPDDVADTSVEPHSWLDALESPSLIVTQLYDPNMAALGWRETCNPGTVLFLGRAGDAADYLEKLEGLDARTAQAIAGRNLVVFPIPKGHTNTSRCHAMIFNQEDAWYLVDLASHNGTYVENAEGNHLPVEAALRLTPGDTLCLGASADANRYFAAATLKVSTPVNLSTLDLEAFPVR